MVSSDYDFVRYMLIHDSTGTSTILLVVPGTVHSIRFVPYGTNTVLCIMSVKRFRKCSTSLLYS